MPVLGGEGQCARAVSRTGIDIGPAVYLELEDLILVEELELAGTPGGTGRR